jgi:hypothetical protein
VDGHTSIARAILEIEASGLEHAFLTRSAKVGSKSLLGRPAIASSLHEFAKIETVRHDAA